MFNDTNKRTALFTAFNYLGTQGVEIGRSDAIEEIMVDVAEGNVALEELPDLLFSLST